jgi:hypothetical protein
MPQFDLFSFAVNVFYFFFGVIFFFIIFPYYYLNFLAEVKKMRSKLSDFAIVMKNKIQFSDLNNKVMKHFKRK